MKTRIFQVAVFIVAVIVIYAFKTHGSNEGTASIKSEPATNVEATEKVEETTIPVNTVEESEEEPVSNLTGREASIDSAIRNIVSDFNGVKVKNIEINKNVGTDTKDDYITLVRLSYDNPNEAKTSKKLIDLYNNDLGARIANEKDITKLVIFWEVPYLQSGKNSAKAILELKNDKMVFDSDWYDPNVY